MTTTITAVQPRIHLSFPAADRFDADAINRNIDICSEHVKKARSEFDSGLVVFPEFFLTGYTFGIDVSGWIRASISMTGPEIEKLCQIASDEKTYVAGAAYEVLEEFPGRFFNTSFVISPDGEVILKYRKLYAMTDKTRPSDVMDEWLEKFGLESLLPVVDTPIGRLGSLIARDALWPEMARCLALKGAEILITHNAAGAEPQNAGVFARQSRAFENHCYLVTSNIGPFVIGKTKHYAGNRAPCEIIDYQGNLLAKREENAEFMLSANIDIEELRHYRISGSEKGSFLAQLQPELHTPIYQNANLFPANGWKDKPIQSGMENKALEKKVIERMISEGVLIEPKSAKQI